MAPCDVAQIDRLASGEEFDLVIVGGGATGAGAALAKSANEPAS